MVLSDRQAADTYAAGAVAEAHRKLVQATNASRHQPGLGFRNGLIDATKQLASRLVEIYSELDGAAASARDELIAAIRDRISAFIQSSVAGQRGMNAGAAAREGSNLIASYSAGVARDFDLAVYENTKKRAALVGGTVEPIHVLFLSANPDPASPLNVEREESRIAKVRNGSKHQDRVRIESLPDLDLPEFAKSLRLHAPAVVHFSGHPLCQRS